MKRSSVMVGFDVYGDKLAPHIITERLGIKPTASWIKGDPVRPGSESTRAFNYWGINPEYEESDDVGDQLEKTFCNLRTKVSRLVELKQEYGLEYRIDIVLKIEDREAPRTVLDNWLIDFAQSIQARIWIDIYVCS